jgi:hypothetical protein
MSNDKGSGDAGAERASAYRPAQRPRRGLCLVATAARSWLGWIVKDRLQFDAASTLAEVTGQFHN